MKNNFIFLDKEIKNIPFKHYGNEDKMVFSLELNEFSWVKLSEVPPQKAKQSNSTPFQCDANLCVDYLKDLNLKGIKNYFKKNS